MNSPALNMYRDQSDYTGLHLQHVQWVYDTATNLILYHQSLASIRNFCHPIISQLHHPNCTITSHHITLHHITSHHITLHHIISYHITSQLQPFPHIPSHRITSHHITSHHITSHHIISYHIISHHITSYNISYHIMKMLNLCSICVVSYL